MLPGMNSLCPRFVNLKKAGAVQAPAFLYLGISGFSGRNILITAAYFNGYKFSHCTLTIMNSRKNERLFFFDGLKFIIRLIKSHDFSLKLSQPVLTVTNS